MSTRLVQGSRKKQLIGAFGERIAATYLQETLGWDIICQNWRCREGEIDIVARDGETLVVVEVRTRQSLRAGSAIESVDTRKQKQLLRLTKRLLLDRAVLDACPSCNRENIRIDIIGLLAPEYCITEFIHLRNAVFVMESY